ncbi:MAG: enoyl-CoA hydratase/isomerase family protein [Panacagrimonas sp.]
MTIDNGIATVTLNRPGKGNAIDLDMARRLSEVAIACDEDRDIRCVVLTAAGKMFCVGGDIGAFGAASQSVPALLKSITTSMHSAIARFLRMEKPLVCAINGPAAGAGLGFALMGDIVIAARAAHFTMAYTAIGLTPDGATTWLLPRLVGLRRAQEMAVTNRRVGADEAVTLGLITRAVDDALLTDDVRKTAQSLRSGATPALGTVRSLLLSSFSQTLETQMEQEARSISEAAYGAYGREGIQAFLEKRKPVFG